MTDRGTVSFGYATPEYPDTAQVCKINNTLFQVGWKKDSWGWHGDDDGLFHNSGIHSNYRT